jgi:hypothetical protein
MMKFSKTGLWQILLPSIIQKFNASLDVVFGDKPVIISII